MSNPLLKISRQNEKTWALFHRRVATMPVDYSTLFPETVYEFIEQKAKSMGSSVRYFIPSLLTATSYLLATKDSRIQIGNHLQPLNLYTIFVGYPGTGKSPAVESIIDALESNECLSKETLLSSATSAGMINTLAKKDQAFMASPEVFDILNKLLKNDDDGSTGDVQLLCKLWSGESSAYHFATQGMRSIDANTPFCILGATQIPHAATMIHRMDKGHGLLDRFLITVPMALKPTPQEQSQALSYLQNLPVNNLRRIFAEINESHMNITRTYALDANATTLHSERLTEHVNEVNNAIRNGEVPPKSKGSDLVLRIAVPLQILTYHINCLLNNQPCNNPPEMISKEIYIKALTYNDYLHAQKDMFVEFLKSIVEQSCEPTKNQPSQEDIQAAILKFPGKVLTYQAFKKYSSRSFRSIQKPEFEQNATQLSSSFGEFVKIRVPRSSQRVPVFIKKTPAEWPATATCTREEFTRSLQEPNKLVTGNILQSFINNGHLEE